jgi:O-antigen ligase
MILIVALMGLVGLVIFGAIVYLAVRLALKHSRREPPTAARIEVSAPADRREPGRAGDGRTTC